MTCWNYFLVNIYLSFSFGTNQYVLEKKMTVLLASSCCFPRCKKQNLWETFQGDTFQGSEVLNVSLHAIDTRANLAFSFFGGLF